MEPDSFNRQVETSSAFFQQMVDTSSAAIFIYQQDRFIYINAAAEQLSGYAHQELLDMPCWQVLHVADQAEAKQRAGMLQSGELDESHANVRFMKKDGSTVQVLYRTQRINYHGQTAICGMVTAIECRHHCVEQAHQRLNGRLVDAEVRLNRINFSNEQTIQTTMVDVAERKRTRGRLQRRLLIEQTLANISHQLLSIEKTDLNSVLQQLGWAMQVDRIRIFLLHGYATEVINMTWEWCANGTWSNNAPLQAMSTATFPWTMKQVHAGQQIIIPNVNHLPAEAGAEQAHFQAHELQSLVIIPLLNSRGVALGYIGFGDMHQRRNWTDELQSLNVFADMISATLERRCFIKRLQQGEQDMLKTQAMAHIGSWAIYPAKPENDTLSAEVFRMFNICRDEPMNYKSFLQRLHPDDKRHVLAVIRAALGGTPFINLCYRIIRSGGIVRHIQANGDVQCDPITNRVKSIYGTVQDITERVELEALDGAITQAQAASKAKGDFLAVMSHELRTPLHGIIGLQNLLAQDLTDLPSKQRERLALAQHSAHILSSLIDDILDLSKIESGSMVLQESTFNLQGLLHNAMLTFLATAQQKQIQLELVLDDVPEMVVGDAVRLRQVLLNIVGNAMKFTQQGGVRLYAHYRERSLDQEAGLLIDIRDSGIGMAAGDLAQLFQPFKQCGQRVTRQGTGLGTTIAMQFARMMGGDITVESEPDKGSIFHISLALGATGDVRINQQIEITSHTLSANAAPLPGVELHNLKLLLAEDDPIARFIAMENIRRIGLHVDVAENGLIAWKKVQNGDYDVLLTDIRMPGIDGIELTKKIRAHEHSKDDVRITIIGLSAHAMAHVADEAYAAGMDAFIAKPIESEALLHRLNAIMAYSDAAVMA